MPREVEVRIIRILLVKSFARDRRERGTRTNAARKPGCQGINSRTEVESGGCGVVAVVRFEQNATESTGHIFPWVSGERNTNSNTYQHYLHVLVEEGCHIVTKTIVTVFVRFPRLLRNCQMLHFCLTEFSLRIAPTLLTLFSLPVNDSVVKWTYRACKGLHVTVLFKCSLPFCFYFSR